MGARPWRITTTCTALLLAATGCVVGPTVEDEAKKPVAPTEGPTNARPGATGVPGQGQQPPHGGSPIVSAPGGPTKASPPPPVDTRVVVGSSTPFPLGNGVNVWVESLRVVGPAGDAAGDAVRIAVAIRVENKGNEVFQPHDLDVQLLACPEIGGACTKRSGAASEEPQKVPVGSTASLTRYFAASRANAAGEVTLVARFKAQSTRYVGVPTG